MITRFVNIHTHFKAAENELVIRNAFHYAFKANAPRTWYSVGIHPWQVWKFKNKEWENLGERVQQPMVVAIGEIGLDKRKTDFALQEEIFEWQLGLAEYTNLPVIIHCVKAYEELYKHIREVKTPIVLHNYFGSTQQSEKLLALPQVYFSLGKQFANGTLQQREDYLNIPMSRIFTETDTRKNQIENQYEAIAKLYKVTLEELKTQMIENTKLVFPLMDI